jgi:hypothetical protein
MSTIEDYFRELGLLDVYAGLSAEQKLSIVVSGAFAEWLKAKNLQQSVTGKVSPIMCLIIAHYCMFYLALILEIKLNLLIESDNSYPVF